MKIKLIGKNLEDIRPLLLKFDLIEAADGEKIELVIAHGGDGTMLLSEQMYPNIPKLPLRDVGTAPLCANHTYEKQLKEFASGNRRLSLLPKLEGLCNNGRLLGINDIFIHNLDRMGALRYRVWIDGELYANEVVGDGVGMSTVHGSTAYYRSITHSIFKTGLGLAFSNSTEAVDHLVVKEESVVEVEIIRGPGIMVADNSPDVVELKKGDRIIIRRSEEFAGIYNLESFMCPCCRLLRHPNLFESRVFAAALAGRAGEMK